MLIERVTHVICYFFIKNIIIFFWNFVQCRSYNKNYQVTSADDLALYKNDKFFNQQQHQMDQNEHANEDGQQTTTCLFSLFLQSNNPPVRVLSCLIILRTLNQADYVNNVFEIMRGDLKKDTLKKLFLNYYGTWTIIKWCKLTNKVYNAFYSKGWG